MAATRRMRGRRRHWAGRGRRPSLQAAAQQNAEQRATNCRLVRSSVGVLITYRDSVRRGLPTLDCNLYSQAFSHNRPTPEHPIPFSITCAARSFRKSRDPAPIIAPNRTVTESHLLGVCSVTDAKQNGVLFGQSPAATMWPPRLPRAMDNAAASSALTRTRGRQLDHTTPQAHS